MICLAVNTATTVLSVALLEDEKVLHLFETAETRDQGNLLLKHVGEALKKTGRSYNDIDLLAVVTGPGSFTGIRIGLAAMRGIALAAAKPIAGLTSFEMFAENHEGKINAVAVESWREELYFTAYDAEGKTLLPPVNETPELFAARMAGMEGDIFISGDAAQKLAEFLPQAQVSPKTGNAVNAGLLAMRKGAGAEKPLPFYLREADVTFPHDRKL